MITTVDKEGGVDAANSSAEESRLKQIREDFSYCKSYWNENREEAEKDMDCVACIPPPDFKQDRAGRPCIWPDEISQYVKQSNNNWRQSKRGIKISPKSAEATDKDAEHRQAYIRGIEYASKAQSIYTTAYESAAECAFGFWRVTLRVTGPNGEQEPRLARVQNWATCYPDPDAKESDFSDSNIYFVTDTMRQSTFSRRYPKAKKRNFTGADQEKAPGWLTQDAITVAEYWHREEIEDRDGEKLYNVTQRITNGLEILESNDWIGSWIPIIGVFGEELYIRTGGQSKRMFISLVRRARGQQQLLAYIASQMAEEFGMAPRAPLMGFRGTFDSQEHKNINRIPVAYIELNIPKGWQPAWGAPPLPQRSPFTPNIESYIAAYEQTRRSIQSAMGIAPLPTAAQQKNEKSGIALEKIQNEQAIGAFHLTDNTVRAITNTGMQVNELITKLAELDSLPSQLLGKDQKDEDVTLKVAPRQKADAADSEHLDEANYFFAHRGKFEVTVSDGPSYMSQREEASAFADTLLQALPTLGIPPQITQHILAIAVKLKNIGSYGDEIADLLSPPDPNNLPPQAKALLAQSNAATQQALAEVQQLKLEKLGKVTEIQGKMALADKEFASRMSEADKDRETKLAVAEITTKAQSISERVAAVEDLMKQFHDQAHELALSIQQHGQNMQLAQQGAQAQAAQSAQDHGQALAAQAAQPQPTNEGNIP